MDKQKKIIRKNKKGGNTDNIVSKSIDKVVGEVVEKVVDNIIEEKVEIVKKDKGVDDIVIIEKEEVEKLHTGFINTVLTTPILLHPKQMDNNIDIHLKENLKKEHEKKCFKNIGYINNIYKIENIKDQFIDMENSECSQMYIILFSCKLYCPIIGRYIVAKMDKITEKISTAINGPMRIIITPNRIDNNKFYTGAGDMIIRIKPNSEILTQNHYVKIYVEGMTFADKDELIIIIGFLMDIANQDEIKNFYDNKKNEDIVMDDF
jgi:DNA-directed RNA polymerase subunit E'/Rpb7